MPKTVLVAEDDADVRTLLYRLFTNAGYEVWSARDGRDATRVLIENGFPDVMVVDHNMPHKTGLDLIAEVRQREQKRHVVAIIITATHMRSSDDVRSALAHADLMLGKPFDYHQMLQMIDRLLSQRAAD
jgi:CheY-like chemotaxis protein